MRPVNLGVNNLDVTTIDKAKIALEKVNKAKEMIAKERSLIERQVKKWVNQLDSVSIPTYSDPAAKLKNNYNLLLHTLEFNI